MSKEDINDNEVDEELNEINNNLSNLSVPKIPAKYVRPVSPVATRRWKIPKPETAIIIAVSSRALFDMTEERKIYSEQGLSSYLKHMISRENEPLKPGSAFPFVQALTCINLRLLELDPNEKHLFDVVLMSNNSAQIGVALINSINYHALTIERICLTAGKSVTGYLAAYGTDLYLSADSDNVVEALNEGIAAATVFSGDGAVQSSCEQLRIAFDGDAVLFSDESEIIAKEHGLIKFFENEAEKADQPLEMGPLQKFAMALGDVKKKFTDRGIIENCPIRTYLVTARSAASSGLRALRTLRLWGLDIDEALFLAGAPKGPILEKIKPHLFFDDQKRNVDSGLEYGVKAAHVPYGIAQKHTGK
ncbi:cytosolic 5'-nucleotidase 1A [Ciona intestinalis]